MPLPLSLKKKCCEITSQFRSSDMGFFFLYLTANHARATMFCWEGICLEETGC